MGEDGKVSEIQRERERERIVLPVRTRQLLDVLGCEYSEWRKQNRARTASPLVAVAHVAAPQRRISPLDRSTKKTVRYCAIN